MITRTFTQVIPDTDTGTVTVSAYVEINGRWHLEARCMEAAAFTGAPSHADLVADVNEAREMGLFGTKGWWRPVTAPVLGLPAFLFPSAN